MNPLRRTLAAALLACCWAATAACAQEAPPLSRGQTLYLPVYSDIWHGDLDNKGLPSKAPLSALVSIRNTDPAQPIRVLSARYHDTKGRPLRNHVASPQLVPPLGTLELFVERSEASGGSGASFLIRWQSERPANPPIVEAVHTDLRNPRTVSFVTTARPVRIQE